MKSICLQLIPYLGWITGVGILVYSFGQIVFSARRLNSLFLVKEKWKNKSKVQNEVQRIKNNKAINRWITSLQSKIDYAGIKLTVTGLLFVSILVSSIGLYIGLFYLHNIPAAVPLAIGMGCFPWGYINYFANKKQYVLKGQLEHAIHLFITEYSTLPNITSVFTIISSKLEAPLRFEVEQLIRELNSGRAKEDALFSFARRLNSKGSYRLAHILNLRLNNGVQIENMLFNLYMDLKTSKVKEKERSMESIAVRLESCMIYLFIPVMYLLALKISPYSHRLLTQTPEGKKIMFLIVLFLVIGLISTVKSGSSKID